MDTTEVLRKLERQWRKRANGLLESAESAEVHGTAGAYIVCANHLSAAIDEALAALSQTQPGQMLEGYEECGAVFPPAAADGEPVAEVTNVGMLLVTRHGTRILAPGDKLYAAAPSAVAPQEPLIFSRRDAIAKELGISHDRLFVDIVRAVERAHGIGAPGGQEGDGRG